MRLLLIFFVILFFQSSNSLSAQEPGDIFCKINWNKGEEKVLSITHTKTAPEKNSRDLVFNYEAHITILDSSDEGYKIRWVFHLPESVKKLNPKLAELMPILEGLEMIFLVNPDGSFQELENWQDVRQVFVDMAMIGMTDKDDAYTKEVMKKTKELFGTREMVEGTLIREIQLYHAPFGSVFPVVADTNRIEYPNPFGGDPLPAISIQQMTKNEPATGLYHLKFTSEIDSTGFVALMKGLIGRMQTSGDSLQDIIEKEMANVQIYDKSVYRVKQSSGWIEYVRFERNATVMSLTQKEVYTIKLKE